MASLGGDREDYERIILEALADFALASVKDRIELDRLIWKTLARQGIFAAPDEERAARALVSPESNFDQYAQLIARKLQECGS